MFLLFIFFLIVLPSSVEMKGKKLREESLELQELATTPNTAWGNIVMELKDVEGVFKNLIN